MSVAISDARMIAALEATWPPAHIDASEFRGLRLKTGLGGGKRVEAAIIDDGAIKARSTDIGHIIMRLPAAEAAMRARGQKPLFLIRPQDSLLDSALQARGYSIVDPNIHYEIECEKLASEEIPSKNRTIELNCDLALADEIWSAGGIGPARRAIMARANGQILLTRTDNAIVGAGFLGFDGEIAMLHAIEIRADHRRQGAGRTLVLDAAKLAAKHGCKKLALVVTAANMPARAMYEKMGMKAGLQTHYRVLA